MTLRKCVKCGESLIVNEKLNLMECVGGKHIEPVNLIRAQWWNQCVSCGQIGTNDIDAERFIQKMEIIQEEVNGNIQNVKRPVTKQTGEKKHSITFEENLTQIPVTCKACGVSFVKKSALN